MYRIGYAPGAFDLLHIGHLDLFRQAKSHCDFLIVGVASDEIVLEYKGALPVIPLPERGSRLFAASDRSMPPFQP